MAEVDEELEQRPDETLEHFITRVVEKWEKQGGIVMDGEVLAKLSPEEDEEVT